MNNVKQSYCCVTLTLIVRIHHLHKPIQYQDKNNNNRKATTTFHLFISFLFDRLFFLIFKCYINEVINTMIFSIQVLFSGCNIFFCTFCLILIGIFLFFSFVFLYIFAKNYFPYNLTIHLKKIFSHLWLIY